MVPAAYVRLESLPLTANGKLYRKGLPVPEGDAYIVRQYEAPQEGVEELLAVIWAKLLNLEWVGRHDSFFELGGHSLLAVQVIARVQEALGLEVALKDLFARPVLQDFASPLVSVDEQPRSVVPPDKLSPKSGWKKIANAWLNLFRTFNVANSKSIDQAQSDRFGEQEAHWISRSIIEHLYAVVI